jgi:hypothetical protein
LTLLLADKEPEKYERAAMRWHVRFVNEVPNVELRESLATLALLAAMPVNRLSALGIAEFLSRRRSCEGSLRFLSAGLGRGVSPAVGLPRHCWLLASRIELALRSDPMAGDWYTAKLRKRRCECGALDCKTEIEITMEEQDVADHSGRNLWIVAPGHDLRGARKATVISSNERFSVVEAVEHPDVPG